MQQKFLASLLFSAMLFIFSGLAHAASTTTTHSTRSHRASGNVQESAHARKRIASLRHSSRTAARRGALLHASYRTTYGRRHHRSYERFTGNSFSDTVTEGDSIAGEDPVVRAAAIEALDGMNGTAVAIDPDTGRILAMVNQKLALSSGAEPCSTIKISVALAALQEHLITKDTEVRLGRSGSMTLTEALAHSNNLYFETLGRELGFERVKHYANQFGLGELAGYNIGGEQLGRYPSQPLPEKAGGVGKMCSFGESVSMTPLQLGALVAAISNGGTLYYLQHPQTPEEVVAFQPRVKRQLDIKPLIPEISGGMEAAVDYGTARSLRTSFSELPVLGKTGTCSANGTRFGWFASFANTNQGRIVTVFFLEGGRPTFGPKAAELTGHFYRALYDHSFFAAKTPAVAEPVLGTTTAIPTLPQ
jgi:beta-lactamase class D